MNYKKIILLLLIIGISINVRQIVLAQNVEGELIHKAEWIFESKDRFISQPVLGENKIIIPTNSKIYSINLNGKKQWSFDKGSLYPPAVSSNGTIYFASGDLIALNSEGKKLWSLEKNNGVTFFFPTLGKNNTIYVGASNSKVYAINSEGEIKWNVELNEKLSSSPVQDEKGNIFMLTLNRKLYYINSKGKKIWSLKIGEPIHPFLTSEPVLGEEEIYVGTGNGLFSINFDGTVNWHFKTSDNVLTPAVDENRNKIYIVAGEILYGLNKKGEKRWSYDIGEVWAPPVIDDKGYLYIRAENLLKFSESCEKKWSYYIGPSFEDAFNSPLIGTKNLMYVTIRNKVVELSLEEL